MRFISLFIQRFLLPPKHYCHVTQLFPKTLLSYILLKCYILILFYTFVWFTPLHFVYKVLSGYTSSFPYCSLKLPYSFNQWLQNNIVLTLLTTLDQYFIFIIRVIPFPTRYIHLWLIWIHRTNYWGWVYSKSLYQLTVLRCKGPISESKTVSCIQFHHIHSFFFIRPTDSSPPIKHLYQQFLWYFGIVHSCDMTSPEELLNCINLKYTHILAQVFKIPSELKFSKPVRLAQRFSSKHFSVIFGVFHRQP